MKRLNYFVCAALAVAAAVSCNNEPEVIDFPIVGDFTIYGASGSAEGTWAANTSVGVYVTSDGVTQENLEYTPSSTEVTESVELKAKGTKAGFKQGDHVVYAYYPYATAEGNSVIIGDMTKQETTKSIPSWVYDAGLGDMADMFASYASKISAVYAAKKEVKEYSSAPIDLGTFAAANVSISVAEPGFGGEDGAALEGKKVEKVVITSNKTIAYKDAKYDVVAGKVLGTEASNSIEIAADMVVKYLGAASAYAFDFTTCLSAEELADATFTIEFQVEGGKKFAAVDYTANASNMIVAVTLEPMN